MLGTGKGLLDSLVAQGGVKQGFKLGVDIEIRSARSDRNSKFYSYLYPEEIFCTHLAKLDPSDIYLLALYIFIK